MDLDSGIDEYGELDEIRIGTAKNQPAWIKKSDREIHEEVVYEAADARRRKKGEDEHT